MKTNLMVSSVLIAGLLSACGGGGGGSGATAISPLQPPPVAPVLPPAVVPEPAGPTAQTNLASNGDFTITFSDGTSQTIQAQSGVDDFLGSSDGVTTVKLGGVSYTGLRFGVWVKDGTVYNDAFATGTLTSSLPANGTYTYTGNAVLVDGQSSIFTNDTMIATLNVAGGSGNTVSFTTYDTQYADDILSSNNLPVTGVTFTGALCNAGALTCSGMFANYSGTVKGGFYGDVAKTIGGTFTMKDASGAAAGVGAFGGVRP